MNTFVCPRCHRRRPSETRSDGHRMGICRKCRSNQMKRVKPWLHTRSSRKVKGQKQVVLDFKPESRKQERTSGGERRMHRSGKMRDILIEGLRLAIEREDSALAKILVQGL